MSQNTDGAEAKKYLQERLEQPPFSVITVTVSETMAEPSELEVTTLASPSEKAWGVWHFIYERTGGVSWWG